MTTDPLRNVLGRLRDPKETGPDRWEAFCPVHEKDGAGHRRSLSVARGDDGRVLMNCHAGCTVKAILQAIDLTERDLFPNDVRATPSATASHRTPGQIVATYPYRDESGNVLFEVVRFEPKDFRQRRPDGHGGWTWKLNGVPRILYRLPELLKADPAAVVLIAEGEKDADALAALGLVATTNPGGAGKWGRLSGDSPLHGRRVVILPDRDAPGRAHALDVATRLHGRAASVKIIDLPGDGKDVSDWLELHDAQTPEELRREIGSLADAAPVFDLARVPADESPDADGPTPILICLADVKAKPVQWLWPGRVPLGKLTLFAGDPGLGKSFVTLDLAARVSRGMAWPDAALEVAAPGSVILLSAEDDPADTIRPRLEAAGGDVARVHILTTVQRSDGQPAPFSLDRDLPALARALERVEDPRLLIIDPISAYLGRTDSHINAEVRAALAPLADLAARHGVAVVTITHLSKGMGGKALHRAIGSVAFAATARACWLFAADRKNPQRRLMLPAKMNLAPDPTGLAYSLADGDVPGTGHVGRVAWEPQPVTLTADEALASGTTECGAGGARQEAVDWLQDVLAKGLAKAVDVKKQATADGVALRTLDRAKAALGVKATRQGFGGAWVWALPAHSAPSLPEERQG